jgi:hypothetical protein
MTPALISSIQAFTLTARKLLERETEEQLQGLYGWLPDGFFGVGTALSLPEAAGTRARLELYVAEENEAGLDAAAARAKLKRETAFTWLNRAVAIRLMEERGIIKSTFAKLHKSNAFIYWLTDVKGEASIPASTPLNALGEGPVDAAYREFLLWQCGELAAEVSVLFDPATLSSKLCPRPAVLKELAESMTADDVSEAWKAGNEETIGWVYQGFNTDEKAETFASFQKGKKITAERIGAATQIFTPNWVVRYLIENTLGRIWVEIHPDSRLAGSLEYLVPLKSITERLLKTVKDITFLDPSCGSMHFGVLAFDLFVEMYREERENAGKPGWPDTPSAATEEEIPELILAHNLHGIDIDTRAVQLSALTLVLKARMLNPKARVTDTNLATANIEQLTGGRLDEFISKTPFSHPIYERVLRRLAARLKDSDYLGSLLRIENEIEQLIAAERKKSADLFEKLPGFDPEQFETQEGVEEFFAILTDQIGRHLDHFVQASGGGIFASEAAKGLRFLRLVETRYDVVATNPPYLDSRDYNAVHKAYLEDQFPAAKRNLFAAFIQRCLELADPQGLVGMISGQSFMFISSYETLRSEILNDAAIQTLAQFDYHLFKERVDTAALVLRREPDAAKREGQVGTYFRLVKERDAEAKRLAFESALDALRRTKPNPQVFHYDQADFNTVEDKPWIYWLTFGLRGLFSRYQLLKGFAPPRVGLQTADNTRFLRYFWEVGYSAVDRNCSSRAQTAARGFKWFPYNKGGSPIPWASRQQNVVNWASDGLEIEAIKPKSVVRNPDYYFRAGVTWSLISTRGFAARISPNGFIFDVAGMTCFPKAESTATTLAVLNSKIARFLLSAISPTINYQVGDIERLPVPSERSLKIDDLVNRSVEFVRQDSRENETTCDFIQPLRSIVDRTTRKEQLGALEAEIDAEVSRLYGLSEEDLAAIDRELNTQSASIGDYNKEADTESGDSEDEAEATADLSPADWARSWISYALGTVLGRFEIGQPGGLGCGDVSEATVAEIRKLIDPDGIMPCDAGHPQDIAARAFGCLELMLGATPARDAIRNATDTEGDPVEALRGWLDRFTGTPDRSFWKYHHQLYRKRPVYWPFQSPKKTFTLWVFHEKIGPNTLHTLKDLTDVRLNLLEREITDLRPAAATNRAKEKELQKLLEQSDDLREFSNRLKVHIDAGYTSCIDDGVLLNAAPLHDLFPSWTETAAAWQELKAEKYEWSHQAMRHWPDRVTEACRSNRSFAIAHNLEHLCPAAPPKAKRGKKKAD